MKVIILISLFTLCGGFNIFKSFWSGIFGGENRNKRQSEITCNGFCGIIPKSCPKNSRYRTIDGSCNNIQNPSWGTPNTSYVRLQPSNYGDDISSMPTTKSGCPLMSTREISLLTVKDKPIVDTDVSLTAMQFGQLVAHDMSLTAGVLRTGITCCANGQDVGTNPRCANIPVPPNDDVHPGQKCLNFLRTLTTKDNNCTTNNVPAAPLSIVTAFLDTSFLYGSTDSQAKQLRTMVGGRMKTVTRNGQEWPPQVPQPTQICNVQSNTESCYLAGDIRINQNVELAMLQLIFLRKHNQVADYLHLKHVDWSDEKVYQETRRIMCAYNQHITYYEFLPQYLGRENMLKKKLIYENIQDYINDYDPRANPGVSIEHASVAFRFLHSAIAGMLKMYRENGEFAGSVRLSSWMLKPSILEEGSNFAQFARGINTQPQMAMDINYDNETTTFLFRGNNENGTDLAAIDYQRARDHGVASYNDLRTYCGFPRAIDFCDFYDLIPKKLVEILQKIYKTPDDVELAVGGGFERLAEGARVGPTFLCILEEQFSRTRRSDRYFFELGDQDGAFTPEQLSSIRRGATMSRIFCDVAGIKNIQRKAFELISDTNPVVSCDEIETIDLTLW
ncbi:peroxidase [Manduca sexta]|uniref:peroxidase n=1 Tax=Manduca sexta TaxID=7130 RepID=UPI00189001DA|nr:peroxidase [Manduca sexta]XP_037296939.1 peroxidase [Manduca sexta]